MNDKYYRDIDDNRENTEMHTPFLSVCIPVYNASAYLARCVEPLLEMGDDVQIILSDDASKDNSYEICLEYERKNKNVVALTGPNGGPSAARNRALEHVIGKYVVFVDADDWLEPVAIEHLKRLVEEDELDFIQFGVISEFNNSSSRRNLLYDKTTRLTDTQYRELFAYVCGLFDDRNLGFEYFGLITCKFFKAEILDGLRFDPEIVGEDTFYAIQAMKKVKSAAFLAEYLYHYYIINGSYSHRPFPNIFPMATRMLERMQDELDMRDSLIRKAFYCHAFGKFKWVLWASGFYSISSRDERAEFLRTIFSEKIYRRMLWGLPKNNFTTKKKIVFLMLKLGMYKQASTHLYF